MSRNIKTVKCLRKHVGKTVHVKSFLGLEFDATVELDTSFKDEKLRLYTDDDKADKDPYWWTNVGGRYRYGHSCIYNHQITKELKSLALVTTKKDTKKSERVLTKDELDAARGHFCLLQDGTKGFICVKIASDKKPTRILHNSSDSRSWSYTEHQMFDDNAPEAVKHDFKKAHNIWNDSDSLDVKVVKVLEKYDGRKYRYKKAKKATTFLTAHEIKKGIGHLCKLADGQEAFIATNEGDVPIICIPSRYNSIVWSLDASVVAKKFRDSIKDYKYGWGIHCENDANRIKVVKILDEPKEEAPKAKTAESPKTILDMTIRELWEKLNEIIKR